MKTTVLTATALATLTLAGSALAGDRCQVPRDQWQPQSALEQQLSAKGWDIKRVKQEEGCYEVYALDADGHRREVYFDPKTLAPVGGEDD